jgi:hypothetical protein
VTAASGAFAHHNSRARLPILTARRIVPGDVAIRDVAITNDAPTPG